MSGAFLVIRQRNTEGPTGVLAAWTDIDALEDEFDDANVESLPVVLLEVWHPRHDCNRPSDSNSGPIGLILRELADARFQRLGAFTFKNWLMVREYAKDSKALRGWWDQWEQTWHDQQHWFDTCENEQSESFR